MERNRTCYAFQLGVSLYCNVDNITYFHGLYRIWLVPPPPPHTHTQQDGQSCFPVWSRTNTFVETCGMKRSDASKHDKVYLRRLSLPPVRRRQCFQTTRVLPLIPAMIKADNIFRRFLKEHFDLKDRHLEVLDEWGQCLRRYLLINIHSRRERGSAHKAQTWDEN